MRRDTLDGSPGALIRSPEGCPLANSLNLHPLPEWIATYHSEPYASLPPIAEAILEETWDPSTYGTEICEGEFGVLVSSC